MHYEMGNYPEPAPNLGALKARPDDQITRAGTAVEMQAGGIPVVIRATQTSERAEPKVTVQLLDTIDPEDVSHYAITKKNGEGVIYPVLKGAKQYGGLAGYDNYVDGFYEMGGLFSIIKKAGKFVKEKLRPGRRFKKFRAKRREKKRLKKQFKKMSREEQEAFIDREAGKVPGGRANFKRLQAQIDAAAGTGEIDPELYALYQAQLARGDVEGAMDTMKTADPVKYGKPSGEMPTWVVPVAVGAGVLLIMQMTKGKKRR